MLKKPSLIIAERKAKKLRFFVFAGFIAATLFIFLFFRSFIFFSVLFFLSFELQHFFYTKQLKINPGHVFFISLVIAREKVWVAIAFLLLCGFFAELIAGYLEAKTFLAYPLYIAFAVASAFFRDYNLLFVGIFFSTICYIILYLSADAVAEPLPEKIFEIIIPGIMNLIYFSSFSGILDFLIKSIT